MNWQLSPRSEDGRSVRSAPKLSTESHPRPNVYRRPLSTIDNLIAYRCIHVMLQSTLLPIGKLPAIAKAQERRASQKYRYCSTAKPTLRHGPIGPSRIYAGREFTGNATEDISEDHCPKRKPYLAASDGWPRCKVGTEMLDG